MNDINLPYKMILMAIQDTLQIYYESTSNYGYNYLKDKCQETTRLTNTILPNLQEQAGYFQDCWHAWNYDAQNNLIIDLSAWQFQGNNISPNKVVFSPNSQFHSPSRKSLQTHKKAFELRDSDCKKNLEELLEIYNSIKDGY